MKAIFKNDLTLTQFERRFELLRSFKDKTIVREGWIKYMRTALGLTLVDLAKLVSLSRVTLAQTEAHEIEGKVTIATLKKMAEAMECDFVYAFVPKKDLRILLHDQAVSKATQLLESADHHMKLERQGVEGDKAERIERLARTLIEKGDIW